MLLLYHISTCSNDRAAACAVDRKAGNIRKQSALHKQLRSAEACARNGDAGEHQMVLKSRRRGALEPKANLFLKLVRRSRGASAHPPSPPPPPPAPPLALFVCFQIPDTLSTRQQTAGIESTTFVIFAIDSVCDCKAAASSIGLIAQLARA